MDRISCCMTVLFWVSATVRSLNVTVEGSAPEMLSRVGIYRAISW